MTKRVDRLNRASNIWQEASLATYKERLPYIEELRDMGLFSNRQISKIARVGNTTVNRVVVNRSPGGRLNPESLSAIALLRSMYDEGQPLPFRVIQAIVADGTSLNNLCRLVGVSPVALYRKLKEEQ